MTIGELAHELPQASLSGPGDIFISGIACDSRQVRKGDLFFCIKGYRTDGHAYAGAALAAGASALLTQDEVDAPEGIPVIRVPDSRRAMALGSSAFFGHPERRLTCVGVTGTNGKTTTTVLLERILSRAGRRPGLMGTLHLKLGDEVRPVKNTTPESLDFYRLLDEMVRRGLKSVVMEVSSHALSLDRVYGCPYETAVFTNLTQDHLDFHENLDNYFEAKRILFTSLGAFPGAANPAAVVNIDDPRGDELLGSIGVRSVTYGIGGRADLRAEEIAVTGAGNSFAAVREGRRFPVRTHLTGRFNVYNTLAALAAADALGIPIEQAIEAVEAVEGVDGRFEAVKAGQQFTVLVDYAHTPDSLENVLEAARELTKGRLITVFGCGGDRDRTKRPLMGGIAQRLSDRIVVTSDNPRTENPQRILQDILTGVTNTDTCLVEADRKTAIELALAQAREGDTVVIAGKGHETYQIFHDRTIHFDDREVAGEYLRERYGP